MKLLIAAVMLLLMAFSEPTPQPLYSCSCQDVAYFYYFPFVTVNGTDDTVYRVVR